MPKAIRYEAPRRAAAPGETVVTSTCGHNCGGRCVVNAHVRDGQIVKISTDPRKWTPELPPLHACVRGFGQLERVNHPGPAAATRCAARARAAPASSSASRGTRRSTRSRARCCASATRTATRPSSTARARAASRCCTAAAAAKRFLYMFGGCTELWSNMSAEAEVFAVRMTYGAKADYKSAGREPTDYVNSRLIVMWGWSPADGTFGTGTLQYLKRAKKQRRADRLRRSAAHAHEPGAGRRARLHPARRPTPPR